MFPGEQPISNGDRSWDKMKTGQLPNRSAALQSAPPVSCNPITFFQMLPKPQLQGDHHDPKPLPLPAETPKEHLLKAASTNQLGSKNLRSAESRAAGKVNGMNEVTQCRSGRSTDLCNQNKPRRECELLLGPAHRGSFVSVALCSALCRMTDCRGSSSRKLPISPPSFSSSSSSSSCIRV